MDINDFRALMTVVVFVVFIGIWIWAWSDKRKPGFEEAARLPFDDEPASDKNNGESSHG